MSAASKKLVVSGCLVLGLLAGAAFGPKVKKRKAAPRQYKRVHQKMMKQLLAGEHEKAAAAAEGFLEGQGDDAESLYCLAIAQAGLKKMDAAAGAAARAVKAGLPVERFFAGPRELTQALVGSEAFAAQVKPMPIGLLHGPMVGCVTDRGARFWVRTAEETTVQVVVTAAKGMHEPIRSPVTRTQKDRDFTAVAEVAGLKAATAYHYDVLIGGKSAMPRQPWSCSARTSRRAASRSS